MRSSCSGREIIEYDKEVVQVVATVKGLPLAAVMIHEWIAASTCNDRT